ncbi:hypothetical protein OG427_09520 [Streptomyces sp. NBC_00133]|uniref:hypothetical protein n=1 Tax=Streptomyces sp. NBC_00133 TaxID=2903624 RepID=UPI003255F994
MNGVLTGLPELSCYTANLVSYLEPELPQASRRLAEAVRLAVRVDEPGGHLAFSHHHRIDLTGTSGGLAYRSAAQWPDALAALRAELALSGRVLAVGNTRHVPWSPAYGKSTVAHWVLLEAAPGRPDSWRITDRFAALLPEGEQLPYSGVVDDDGLRELLTPLGDLQRQYVLRDIHALGVTSALPEQAHYRWLVRDPLSVGRPQAGRWLADQLEVLEFLADRLGSDSAALAAHADDLWAASRHQRHRLELLARRGQLPEPVAHAAMASWAELPRSLRFAVTSAERGRPRPGVVAKAFADLISTMTPALREEHS